jgi:hypothetical protein
MSCVSACKITTDSVRCRHADEASRSGGRHAHLGRGWLCWCAENSSLFASFSASRLTLPCKMPAVVPLQQGTVRICIAPTLPCAP